MAARVDFLVDQGGTFRSTVTFQHDDKSPVDFTGCAAKMQVRASFTSGPPILEMTTENGGLTIGTGEIAFYLSSVQTANIQVRLSGALPPSAIYFYDLFCLYPSGDRLRVLYGTITVSASVTKS